MQSASVSHGDSALHGFCPFITNMFPKDELIANGRNCGSLWFQGLQTSWRWSSSRKAHCRDLGGEGHSNGSTQVRLSGELNGEIPRVESTTGLPRVHANQEEYHTDVFYRTAIFFTKRANADTARIF